MALQMIVGHAQALDGREAASQATHAALAQLGRNPIQLGLVISSHHYPIQQITSGVATLLGDAPLLGFSSWGEFTHTGIMQRSVIVALLSGADLTVRADYWPGFSEDSRTATQKMAQAFQLYQADGLLLLCADGLTGNTRQLCAALPHGNYTLAGCLASGDLRRARTYQIGGRQSGYNGLAAALLGGPLVVSVGLAHGWQPVGAYFKVTQARGPWLRMLDNQPVADIYADLFGYPTRDWLFPPLNELIRLYPLAIESEGKDTLLVRSPLRMESDGSLRMNTSIPEGSTAHLLTANMDTCRKAARQAAEQALIGLKGARPVAALVFTDIAWRMMFEAQPGAEIAIVGEVLGADLPLVGGYTFGQIGKVSPGNLPELFNQHIEVVVLGEASAS